MKTLLILMLIVTQSSLSSEPLKIYAESSVYYIPSDQPQDLKKLIQINKHYGGFYERHTQADDIGGEWNLELRLHEDNSFNVLFWLKDRSKPEINQDYDLSKMAINSLQLLNLEDGEIRLNIVPKIIEEELKPIAFDMDSFALHHFCFNNSAMVIDDNFYIGKLQGFGERIQIRIPEFYTINVALKPLKEDWQEIGIFQEGAIELDVDENHLLSILNVGIGPSGFKKGGPFKVYGSISENTQSREEVLQIEEKYGFTNSPPRVKDIITKANRENLYSVAGVTTATDSDVSKHVERTVGSFFSKKDCGY